MNNRPIRSSCRLRSLMKTLLGAVLFAAYSAAAQTPDVVVTAVDEAPMVLSAAELEALVAPIALYPDDLLAVVLPASTYPVQLVQAARLLETARTDKTVKPDDEWDDSIVALMNYPEVVNMMNRDLDWTWKLGDAVLNQQPDVLNAVEQFRARAQAAGNLKTDERQVVTVTPDAIQIAPADPKVIYVPYYEPARVTVYQSAPVYHYYPVGYPVYYYPYPFGYTFDSGYFWGVTSVYTLGWSSRHMYVYPYHSHYHPYYGQRYYNHYYRRPWGGHDSHSSRWASNWNGNNHQNQHGRDGRNRDNNWRAEGNWRGSDGRDDNVWRHDRSRGGARPHNDGRQHDARQNQNRFQFPTNRTAFRSTAPDERRRHADALTEAPQARAQNNPQWNQAQRGERRSPRAGSSGARPQRERSPRAVAPQTSNPLPTTAARQRGENPRARTRVDTQTRRQDTPVAQNPRFQQSRRTPNAQDTPLRSRQNVDRARSNTPALNAETRVPRQNVMRSRAQQPSNGRTERRQQAPSQVVQQTQRQQAAPRQEHARVQQPQRHEQPRMQQQASQQARQQARQQDRQQAREQPQRQEARSENRSFDRGSGRRDSSSNPRSASAFNSRRGG